MHAPAAMAMVPLERPAAAMVPLIAAAAILATRSVAAAALLLPLIPHAHATAQSPAFANFMIGFHTVHGRAAHRGGILFQGAPMEIEGKKKAPRSAQAVQAPAAAITSRCAIPLRRLLLEARPWSAVVGQV